MPRRVVNSEPQSAVERLLDALPQPALLIGTNRRVLAANRQFRRRFGVTDVENRPFCYRLLHGQEEVCTLSGQACPLEISWHSAKPTRSLHVHAALGGARHVDVETRPITDNRGRVDSFLQLLTPVEFAHREPSPTGLVGRSPAFNRLLEQVQRAALTSCCVLVTGESGAGKESVARALHQSSHRAGHPFISIDCSGLSEAVFEREVFGRARGAYAGAEEDSCGLVRAADGGTFFLNEVDFLPRALQTRVLRLVETGFYRPEGSPRAVSADIRIISSSDKRLDALAQEGRVRGDLLMALSTLQIEVPSLRDRTEDIPLLATSLLQRLRPSVQGCRIHPSTLEVLQAYRFPGNLRELHTILERASLLAEAEEILPKHLPEECRAAYAARVAVSAKEPGQGSKRGDSSADVN